jgi:hypothetical protein
MTIKTLRNILVGGGIFLASACSSNAKIPNFNDAEWISVPYNREVWSGYMGEDIARSRENWDRYQWEVGSRINPNNSGYSNLRSFRGDSISLPDLDKDGWVTSGRTKHSR